MLDKCANPACPATFRNLRDGRVFVTEVEADDQTVVSGHAHQRQYFWLCGSCSRTMTVTVEKGKTVQVVRLAVQANAARAASLGSLATTWLAVTSPARTKPPASAVAIFPAPRKPMVIFPAKLGRG